MNRQNLKDAATALLGPPTYKHSNDLRWGRHGSLSVSLEADKLGYWYDHEAGEGGGFYSLVARTTGLADTSDAISWVQRRFSVLPASKLPYEPSSDRTGNDWKIRKALEIWGQAVPVCGSPAEKYLHLRALPPPSPDVVRFHPACPVRLIDQSNSHQPALIGLFRDIKSDAPVAVQRTFLRSDGSGKSDVPLLQAQKQMLGPVKGAVMKISADEDVTNGLVVAEGLETALSVYAAGWRPTWAVGSAASLANLPPLTGIDALTVMGDRDDAGIAAAAKCAANWRKAGAEVCILIPKCHGDWNDWIREETDNA